MVFFIEKYSNAPKTNYVTNKIGVIYIDKIWNMDSLDLKCYAPKNVESLKMTLSNT